MPFVVQEAVFTLPSPRAFSSIFLHCMYAILAIRLLLFLFLLSRQWSRESTATATDIDGTPYFENERSLLMNCYGWGTLSSGRKDIVRHVASQLKCFCLISRVFTSHRLTHSILREFWCVWSICMYGGILSALRVNSWFILAEFS